MNHFYDYLRIFDPVDPYSDAKLSPHLHACFQDMPARDPGIYQGRYIYRTQDGENRNEEQINFGTGCENCRSFTQPITASFFWHKEPFFLRICTFSVYCTTINRQSLVVPDFFLLVTKDFQSVLEGAKKPKHGQIESKLAAISCSKRSTLDLW